MKTLSYFIATGAKPLFPAIPEKLENAGYQVNVLPISKAETEKNTADLAVIESDGAEKALRAAEDADLLSLPLLYALPAGLPDTGIIPVHQILCEDFSEREVALVLSAVQHTPATPSRSSATTTRSKQQSMQIPRHSPVGIYRSTPEGRFLVVNNTLVAMLGYDSVEEVLQLNIPRDVYVDPAQREALMKKIAPRTEPQGVLIELKRKDGETIYCRAFSSTHQDDKGNVEYFEGIIIDITQQVLAEQALRESQEQLASIFRFVPIGIALNTWPQGRFVNVNPAFERIFGVDRSEVIGKTSMALGLWDSDPERRGEFDKAIQSRGVVLNSREVYQHPQHGKRYLKLSSELITIQGQKHLISIVTDITEQVLAEQALRASEEKFSAIFRFVPNAIVLSTYPACHIHDCNPAFEKIFDVNRADIMGKTNFELGIWPTDDFRDRVIKMLGEKQFIENGEIEFVTNAGVKKYLLFSAERLTYGGKDYIVSIFTDITDQKRSEFLIRESEARFRHIYENTPIMMHSINREGKIINVNRFWLEKTGYTREEVIGKDLDFLMTPESARKAHEETLPKFWRERQARDIEYQYIKKDGTVFDVLLDCQATIDPAGQEISLTVVRDVSELRKLVKELHQSNERYRSLVEMSPIPVAVHTDGVCTFINPAAVEALGGKHAEDFLGKPAMDFVHPEYRNVVQERIRKAFEIGEAPILREEKLLRLDGTPIIVELMGTLIEFNGKPSLQVVFHDITSRKKAEAQATRFGRILKNSLIEIYIFDAETWRFLQLNEGALINLGYSNKELHEMTPLDLKKELSREQFAALIDPLLAGEKEVVTFEAAHTRKDGSVYPVEIHLQYVQAPEQNVFIAIALDITKRKEAEEARKKLEERILHTQKLESLGVLAGGIAHDFNNLLTGILGNSSLALMDIGPTAAARQNLLDIEEASRRAADLCRQMLAYSGKGKFVIKPINLSQVVEDLTQLLEVSISKKAVVKFNFAENLPLIEGDVTQIRQVVMNLITNASDAIDQKSGVITISTGAMECDREYLKQSWMSVDLPEGIYVYVEVSDTGCGMDAETIKKIFDPFFTTKFTGRGLGLAAVLGIVRGHKGAIKVYSEPGKGTSFKVLFPCAPKEVEEVKQDQRSSIKQLHGSGTILVVDDEDTVRAISRRILEQAGYNVITAKDGREALEVYKQNSDKVSAVLLDMTMPHLNGEETYRELRRINPEVIVVLTSGYNEQEATGRFSGKRLAGFIQKPFQAMDLMKKMQEVLNNPPDSVSHKKNENR